MNKIIIIAALLLFSAYSYAESDTEFSKKFQCPETQTEHEYDITLSREWDIFVRNHPNGILSDFVTQRVKILEDHHCMKTLNNIRNDSNN